MDDYQRTLLIYCREFISDVEIVRSLRIEGEGISALIEEMFNDDAFRDNELQKIIDYLDNAFNQLLQLFSKNSHDTRLDSLYRRAASVRDMCINYLKARENRVT